MSSSLPSGKSPSPTSYDYGLGPYDGQSDNPDSEHDSLVNSIPAPSEPDDSYDFYASGLPQDDDNLVGRSDYYDRLYVGLSNENIEVDDLDLFGQRIVNLSDNRIPWGNDAGVLSSVIKSLFEQDPDGSDDDIQACASDLRCAVRLMRR